ncbi:MAG: dnaB [Dehalococcoidales bacterium]|nr:dnaB [Dehalococcoidales bacterium]
MPQERLPPHDIDAEEAAVGSLLIDGGAIYKIATFLQPADFYREQNQWLYEACLSLYQRNEAINQITLAQELARLGKLETCGGAAYLSHLISIVPTSLDIEHYAQIVHRLAVSRRLIDAARQIETIGYEADPDVDASLNRAEDALFRLRHGQSPRDLMHIRQVLDKYFEPPSVAEGQVSPITRVLSSYAGLDDFLGGFQRSDLVIVAGRPSMGKTSLALSLAANAAVKQGACVAIFSLEMARESLVMRMLASEANVDSRRVQIGHHTTEDEEKRIMDAIGVLSEAPIYIDDSPQLRVVEMRSKARRLNFEHPIDLIILDYLQLMQGDTRTENRVQEISYISRALKALARELNVPLVAVSQLSRAVEWRASHKPQLSDLRESGTIEQDADIVMFIYRDDYYFSREEWETQHPDRDYPEGIADVIVAKHRNGPTGEIKLHFVPKSAKFADISRQELSLL